MPDLIIHGVEFASGQEPENANSATLVRASVTVRGKSLARMLGRQERVLQRALAEATPKLVINAFEKAWDNREEYLWPKLNHAIKKFVRDYLGNEGIVDEGERFPKLEVSAAAESDLPYTAAVDSGQLSVRVEMEFEVLGEESGR